MKNFKIILKKVLKDSEERRKRQESEERQSIKRSDDDWKIIDNYLCSLLLELATHSNGSRIINIDCDSHCMIHPTDKNGQSVFLSNGDRLQINHEDIERFCKENHLRLKYRLNKYQDYKVTRTFMNGNTESYLIRV